MAKLFKKKPKELSQEERINKKVLDEHERVVDKLSKAEPNSDEYDAYLKELGNLENINNEKNKLKNSDKNSKRQHLGTNLITTGGGIITAGLLMGLEKSVPINGQTAKTFIGSAMSIFRKH